jgi:hypothetical protein
MAKLHAKFLMSDSTGSIIAPIRPKAKYRFHVSAILLSYVRQNEKKKYLNDSNIMWHVDPLPSKSCVNMRQ